VNAFVIRDWLAKSFLATTFTVTRSGCQYVSTGYKFGGLSSLEIGGPKARLDQTKNSILLN
jgi:hypothetical protein